MPSVPCFRVRFTPDWRMLLLTALVIGLFLKLGFWQIQRAHEKEQMLAAQQAMLQQAPLRWQAKQALPQQYQRLTVEGHYLPQVFLLDNQHYQHQFGYDVLSPLVLADGSLVMIDRGWLAGDISRQSYPAVDTVKGVITLRGSAYFPSDKQWVLGESLEKKTNKLSILEVIDVKLLEHVLQKKLAPFIIRLDKDESYGFVREWAIVSMPPQRHFAYAVQWFAMAGVVLILFVALNVKRYEKTSS